MEKGKRTQPKPKAKPSPLPFSSVPGQPNRPAQTPLAAQLASPRAHSAPGAQQANAALAPLPGGPRLSAPLAHQSARPRLSRCAPGPHVGPFSLLPQPPLTHRPPAANLAGLPIRGADAEISGLPPLNRPQPPASLIPLAPPPRNPNAPRRILLCHAEPCAAATKPLRRIGVSARPRRSLATIPRAPPKLQFRSPTSAAARIAKTNSGELFCPPC